MIRKDSLGREWQLIESRPRPNYGPEFGYEPIEHAPAESFSPPAADCFADACLVGNSVDAVIRQVRFRTAENVIERIRQSGMGIEMAGPSFVVKTLGKTLVDDDAKLLTMLKPEVLRLLKDR